jgi:hypothetical protein
MEVVMASDSVIEVAYHEIGRLTAQRDALLETLRSMTDRFEKCLVASGTDVEFAAIAVSGARSVIKASEPHE